MTSDTTGPHEANDATGHPTYLIRDSLTTELNSTERQSLARSRKVAFFVLGACAVLASAGAVYFWYLWTLTAKTCLDTYILKTAQSLILNPELATSWQDRFIGLDISSFSALTLAVFLTRLAYGGGKNTIRFFQRDGRSYFQRAYRSVLFTEGFETLCVRFGLLGTLLSFLLAAVSQMSDASTAPSVAPGTTMADVTREVAQNPLGARDAPREIAAADNGQPETGKLSEKIFLLLCASLVSTFVGTGVAYVVTPSLNWLNERAVGLHQVGEADAEYAADEFFRQISRTSQRLAEFETTTIKLTEAAEHISSFEVSVGTVAGKLVELITGLERAIQTFDVSTHTGKQLAKKLDHLQAMSDRFSALLDRLPERLNDPLKNMSLMAKEFRDTALSGEAAFRELKEVAGTARGSLSETAQRTNTNWQMLRDVQDSLRELSKSGDKQTSEVSKLVQAFDSIGDSMGEVVRQLDLIGTHLRQRDGDDHEVARLLAAQRIQLVETVAGGPGDDRQAKTRHSYALSASDLHGSRPWWRRIFG